MKFIIFIVIIWAVVVWFKKFKNNLLDQNSRASKQENAAGNTASNTAARSLEGEKMVQCEYCGVHFPASEAIRADGHIYCSEEHHRLGSHS